MPLNERPKRLVVLGDSHSLWSFASVSPMKRLHVGPVTMHRASRDGIWSLLPATYRPRRSDALMLSFGEIDCRVHLAAVARRSGRDLAAEVNLLCDRFESAATVFAQRFPGRLLVASVIPPAHFGRGINGDSTPLEDYLPEQLFIRSLMNERLAAIPGVSFFDYRAAITAPDGSLSPELSDRRWHLDPTVAGHLVVDAINERPDLPSVGYVPAPANPKSLDRRRSIFKKFRKWSRPYRRSITARLGFRTMKRPGTPSHGAAEDRGHRRDS